ncbi:uncharacterized protein LOC127789809 isoform X2 [Diospyros lotus]|nr:uncharacterized protein LOC127789809 isoform X2 [Diospyros lotus]
MRLVGLKTGEMAEEGRFSTIIANTDMVSLRGSRSRRNESERQAKSASAIEGRDEEDSYGSKATMLGRELIQKQRLQLIQLVQLLKQIETQVNSSHSDILQALTDHRISIHKFFQKAMASVVCIHQAGQNNDTDVTLKLLRATFEHVDVALGSVEGGIEDLMQELAKEMCSPMVEYVRGLKAEMTTGTCLHLLSVVEEMGRELRDGKLELEQAQRNMRAAEERNIETLSNLKKSEDSIRKMKEYLQFSEAKKGSNEFFVPHKFIGTEEDQSKDEKLLWELLKKKRTYRTPESPLGLQGLLHRRLNKNPRERTTRVSGRPNTRSYLSGLTPQSPYLDSHRLLGSSASPETWQVQSGKCITP